MSKETGITVKRSESLSEWYTQVILKAGLVDYSSAKGFTVLRPYGYAIWERIQGYLDARIKRTGHQNAYFPVLIPEGLLRKEEEHFSGFNPEVFWVTHAGDQKLGERLAARPTSETIVYDSFARWVRSWRDLPLLMNIWNSVLRAEIKSTKPFIRTTEFLWQEGHTVHATKKEADKEVMMMLRVYKNLIERCLAIPVLVGTKTEREKFVGALYTTTLEGMMPDGRALQLGTSHNLGQNFSKPFGIKYVGKDGSENYAWTTSWGASWRLIGALIMIHGDDRGLIMPPTVAPLQVVIIPIHYTSKGREQARKKVERISRLLRRRRLRVHVDDREQYTPGWKYNEWELKGVPVRLEVGPRDVKAGQVTLVRRDTFERIKVGDSQLLGTLRILLREVQRNLYGRAKRQLEGMTTSVHTYEEFERVLKERGGFLRACWCLNPACEAKVKEESGADVRAIPLGRERVFMNCFVCQGEAKAVSYFAKGY